MQDSGPVVFLGKEWMQTHVKSGLISGVHGEMALVVHGFRCKRCDGTIQEALVLASIVLRQTQSRGAVL